MKEKRRGLNQTARITFDTIRGVSVEVWQVGKKEAKEFVNGKKGDWVIHIKGEFLDRDERGQWVTIGRKYLYRWSIKSDVPTKMQLAKGVRNCLRQHFEHEIDEGLWVDGERVFDPHRKESKQK